jgi:predicted outer membrane repeat protein
MRAVVIVLAVAAFLFGASDADARTWLVRADGMGDAPTIQAGVDSAGAGDTVSLADGTYTGPGNRDIDYQGKGITVASQSGNPDLCIIDCQGSMENARRGFYFHSGETSEAVLQSVTITNGFAVGGDPEGCGGGIVCFSSSPTVINCKLLNNWADYGGGGISCQSWSRPAIHYTIFHGNEGETQGGGLECMDYSSATLYSCSFSENNAYHGGGIYSHGWSPLTVDQCTFSDNWVTSAGGGMYCGTGIQSELTGCTFSNNVAGTSGGGVFCAYDSDPILTDCVFTGNSSVHGGGIATSYGAPSLTRCVLYANVASGNSWGDGGGIYLRYGNPSYLYGCTLSGNSGGGYSGGYGGGVYCRDGASVMADKSIIAFTADGAAVYCASGSAATLTCCDVFGNAGGDWVGCISGQLGTNNNISEDPLFCGELANSDDPFTLDVASPCAVRNSPCGSLIGARPVECSEGVSTERTTWGRVKAIFR